MPVFGHLRIVSPPHLAADIRVLLRQPGSVQMGTPQDHRKRAEECVAMAQAAQAAQDRKDKALWLTLAQSWVRLGEHVARSRTADPDADNGDDVLAVHSSD